MQNFYFSKFILIKNKLYKIKKRLIFLKKKKILIRKVIKSNEDEKYHNYISKIKIWKFCINNKISFYIYIYLKININKD